MPRALRVASLVSAVALHGAGLLSAQPAADPLAIARTLAATYPTTTTLSYIPALSWGASLRLSLSVNEPQIGEKAIEQLQPYLSGATPIVAEPYRLTNVAGAAVLFDASIYGVAEGMPLAQNAADQILPVGPGELIRFATGWTDDMYMAASLLGRVAAATEDPRYRDVLGDLLMTYAERLQREDGLFVHSAEGPVAWGRGNGFAALGLVEALTYLPDEWEGYPRILEIFQAQMEALARHQSPDGSWRQVVDEPESYQELTVTAMAVTAMARAVRIGWLDADRYLPVIDRAWEAVAARVAEDGSVRDACASTAAGTTLQYYLERPTVNGFDDRAGGFVMMAALEMNLLPSR
jgi:unsaturated rhamnogalacturonyl hydrolase